MAAPTYVDSTGNTVAPGSGTSIVFAWSDLTGVATDDYAFALLLKESTAAFTATPSGWTQYHVWDQATGGFKYRAEVWRKRVSGDSGSITWSWSGSTWREGAMGVWRSAVTTEDPVLPTTPDEDIEASQNAQPSHPGITIERTDSALLYFSFNLNPTDYSVNPTGCTPRYEAGDGVCIFDDLTTSPGATGAISGTMSTDPEYPSTILIELASVGSGAPTAKAKPPFRRPWRVWSRRAS